MKWIEKDFRHELLNTNAEGRGKKKRKPFGNHGQPKLSFQERKEIADSAQKQLVERVLTEKKD